jgi:DNA-binding GntR family transcriptional regulator
MGQLSGGTAFKLPKKTSLASLAFEEIERLILDGVLKPGEQVNEKALSDQNGLSRAPIREACRRLEQAGLVEIILNRGVFVRRISPQTARELCDIRLLLAGYAGRLAASRFSKAQLQRLTKLMERIEAAAAANALAEYYRLNLLFHSTVIEAAGNRRLVELYDAIAKELNLFRWRAFQGSPNFDEALKAHRTIVDAARRKDGQALAQAVEDHLAAANRRLLESDLEG